MIYLVLIFLVILAFIGIFIARNIFLKEIFEKENIKFIDCKNYELKSVFGTDLQDAFYCIPFIF